MKTFAELESAYIKQGKSKAEAKRLATMDKLKVAIERDEARLKEIERIMDGLDDRDPTDARNKERLKLQHDLIRQFSNNDKEQLKALKGCKK